MNTYIKTIFLSNKSESKSFALLTLEKKNNGVFCTLKSYKNTPRPNQSLVLGIKNKDSIFKQNITFNNNVYNFILLDKIDLSESLGCVLVSVGDNQVTPLIWGSEKSDNYKSQIITNLSAGINKIKNLKSIEVKQSVNNVEEAIAPYKQDKIDKNPDSIAKKEFVENMRFHNIIEEVDIDSCAQIAMDGIECDRGEVATATAIETLFESSAEEIEESIDKELKKSAKVHKFYEMIADQLEEIFDKYPKESNLEKLIDNSRWAKVIFENDANYYVVGIIYSDDDIKYICYGVPGSYSNEPPPELLGYSQWFPVDMKDPYSKGYWVMYQDADTGENVLVK